MSLVRVMSAADMAYGQWNCRCLFLSLALLGVLTPCCNVVDDDNIMMVMATMMMTLEKGLSSLFVTP